MNLNMKNFFKKFSIQLKLLLLLTIGLVVTSTLFYFFIPIVFNYPKETYGNAFQIELENTYYLYQVLLISIAIFAIFVIITFIQTRFLITNDKLIKDPSKFTEKEINEVKKKLLYTPYSLYLYNIIIPVIALTIIYSITIHQIGNSTVKIFMLVFSFLTLLVTAEFIYSSSLFKKILLKLPQTDTSKIKKTSLKTRIVYNITPLFLASLLFISLLGYTKVATEKGNSLFQTYRNTLISLFSDDTISSLDNVLELSKEINFFNDKDKFFVKLPNGSFINQNSETIEFSAFFNKYLNELSDKNDGRVYEYYGTDAQAATIKLTIDGNEYIVGIYFNILSTSVLLYFTTAFVVLMVLNILILFLFSRDLSNDIQTVANGFTDMASGTNSNMLDKPLHITSNDEIGNLVLAFNKIQKITKNYVDKIHDNQSQLVEQERLASLGQMIGGIAHNLKTPIMSISGASEALQDLTNELDLSIRKSRSYR